MNDVPDLTSEYESIEAFVQECLDDERETFTHEDLAELAYRLRRSRSVIRKALEGCKLRLVTRTPERRVRGFTTSSHDRWYGPGAARTYGGSGWEQINGFAGQKG